VAAIAARLLDERDIERVEVWAAQRHPLFRQQPRGRQQPEAGRPAQVRLFCGRIYSAPGFSKFDEPRCNAGDLSAFARNC